MVVLPSRSVRKSVIPPGITVFTNGSLVTNFVNECTLFGKYAVGIATACTNPGGTSGNATHCHGSGGSHTHCGGSAPHSHSGGTGCRNPPCQGGNIAFTAAYFGPPSINLTGGAPINTPNVNKGKHGHTVSTGTSAASYTVNSHAGHSHGNSPNEVSLNRASVRFMKKASSSFNMRQAQIPSDTRVFWNEPRGCIPSLWSEETALYGRYLKGIATACTSFSTDNACGAHSHSCSGHCHGLSMSGHSHPASIPTSPGFAANNSPRPGPPWVTGAGGSPQGHQHGPGSAGSASGSGTSTCESHAHCSTEDLKRHEMIVIKKLSSYSLRKSGLPSKSIVMWTGTLASIPSGYVLANGSNCTPDLTDRLPKIVANGCTPAGSSAGSNCHTHCGGSHSHTGTISHSHSITGFSATNPCISISAHIPGPCNSQLTSTNQHGGHNPGSAGGSAPITLPTGGGHTHCTVSHLPEAVQVAFIKKI